MSLTGADPRAEVSRDEFQKSVSLLPESGKIRSFFNAIARRYDLLNTLLSFHLDDLWRRRARRLVLTGSEKRLLDLGTGTGKMIREFYGTQSWTTAIGMDFSEEMLAVAKRDLPPSIGWLSGDFHALPFRDGSFDIVTSAFTLRSVKDMCRFLGEVCRVLAPGGKAAFLCLTRPRQKLFYLLYYPYLRFYLPLVGRLVSGQREAYRFLSDSILTFQPPEKTGRMMQEAGFHTVGIHPFHFGMATLIVGTKTNP